MNDAALQPHLYIYESEARAISAEAESHPDRETGGDLYGTFTHADMPIIWLASGPGPGAQRAYAEFQQDAGFTTEWQRRLHNDFGVQYIGGWHSHHTMDLNRPSPGDIRVAREYALRHGRTLNVEIIVTLDRHGRAELWPYYYFNAQESRLSLANLKALAGTSPLRPRLGADERLFSSRDNWCERKLQDSAQVSKSAGSSTPVRVGKSNSEIAAVPEVLNEEVGALYDIGLTDVSVERSGSQFFISISWSDRTVAAVIEIPALLGKPKIQKISLINMINGINRDLDELTEGRLHLRGRKLDGQTLSEICRRTAQLDMRSA